MKKASYICQNDIQIQISMEDLYLEVAQQLSDMGIDKENLSWSTRLTLVVLILLIPTSSQNYSDIWLYQPYTR